MRRILGAAWRILLGLPLALVSPVLLVLAALLLLLCDIFSRFQPRTPLPPDTQPDTRSPSVVIPNWNGRDLLEKYLPPVLAATAAVPGSEVIVVDNGSTDGSAD